MNKVEVNAAVPEKETYTCAKMSLCLVKHHVIMSYGERRHSLNSALDVDESSVSLSGRFDPEKRAQVELGI
jgi:hypothetical protein